MPHEKSKVNWLEWSAEAFEKAKGENKPILLDIYGVWCHWCHRMDEDNYENDDIARMINEKFIPVRVDTDKRPDINERYNQGGWPTTAFLTPSGRLITGATYIAPAQMIRVLHEAGDFYEKHGEETEALAGKERASPARALAESRFVENSIDEKIVSAIVDELIASFDVNYGGFGYEPKFPLPEAIDIILLNYKKGKDKKLLRIAEKTLSGMMGIFDDEAGGFFRYSVTQDWCEPHYEKMMETNAKLVLNYLHAYAVTGNRKYSGIAEQALSYLATALSDGKKKFYGSQDADGEYDYYGKSLKERAKMPVPYIDKTVYANLQSLAIIAFLEASAVLKNDRYRELALGALDFIIGEMYREETGVYHYHDGCVACPHVFGLLTDNAHALLALLKAHEITGDMKYIAKAEHIASFMLSELKDGNSAFFDRAMQSDDIGYLKERQKQLMDNAVAAHALLKLSAMTGKEHYRDAGREALQEFAHSYAHLGLHAAGYALAVETYLNPHELYIVGKKDAEDVKEMLAAANIYFDPRMTVRLLDPEEDITLIEKKGFPPSFAAYLCADNKCLRFSNAQDFEKWEKES